MYTVYGFTMYCSLCPSGLECIQFMGLQCTILSAQTDSSLYSLWFTMYYSVCPGGRKCLQCMDPKEGGPCVNDYMGLVNASLEIFPNGSRRYYKECLEGSNGVVNDYCVIEIFYVGGECNPVSYTHLTLPTIVGV